MILGQESSNMKTNDKNDDGSMDKYLKDLLKLTETDPTKIDVEW